MTFLYIMGGLILATWVGIAYILYGTKLLDEE